MALAEKGEGAYVKLSTELFYIKRVGDRTVLMEDCKTLETFTIATPELRDYQLVLAAADVPSAIAR